MATVVRRTQRVYSLAFKLSVVGQVNGALFALLFIGLFIFFTKM